MFDTTIFGIGSSTADHRATWMIIQIHSWLSYYDFILLYIYIGLFEHLKTALESEPISFPDKDPLFGKLVVPAETLRKTSPAQPVKSSTSRPSSGNRLLRWSQKRSGARSAPISSCTVPGFCGGHMSKSGQWPSGMQLCQSMVLFKCWRCWRGNSQKTLIYIISLWSNSGKFVSACIGNSTAGTWP